MNWSQDDPGAGEPDGIRSLARARSTKADTLRTVLSEVRSAQSDARASWEGKGRTAFLAKADTVLPDLTVLADGLDVQAAALARYAAQVEQIRSSNAALVAQENRARASLLMAERYLRVLDFAPTSARTNPSDTPEVAMRRAQLWSQIDTANSTLRQVGVARTDLVSRRRSADSLCATALGSPPVYGALAGVTPTGVSSMSTAGLLALMGTLSATDLSLLLKQNPGLTQRFWNQPPDAAGVAQWWEGMSLTEKVALIAGAPSIIGNLGGVDYASRAKANEQQLADAGARTDLSDTQRKALAQIKDTLRTTKHSATRELVDFNIEAHPPLAAIAIGDLDTSAKVTWAVPGMDTNVQHGMSTWAQVAQNIYAKQHFVDSGSHAVVAWIGYKTPDMAASVISPGDSSSVFENALAHAGAARLDADLNGLSAVRAVSTVAPPYVSVVAHSYGTTTAAYALTNVHTPVDSVTFVASAGIDSSVVPSAESLDVATAGGHEQVYATQASADDIATIGRTVDPGKVSVGVADSKITLGPENYRINPDTTFGAIRFGSDGGWDGNTYYAPTEEHDALGSGATTPTGITIHGYFDLYTESLHDVALASTGNGAEIPKLTPVTLTHPAPPTGSGF